MLDNSLGHTAEPRNFLRTLRSIPEASGLGLLDVNEPSSELLLAMKIQDFTRFLLEHLNKEDQQTLQEKEQQQEQDRQQKQLYQQLQQQRKQRTLNLHIQSLQSQLLHPGTHAPTIQQQISTLQNQLHADTEVNITIPPIQPSQTIIQKVFGNQTQTYQTCQGQGKKHQTAKQQQCTAIKIIYDEKQVNNQTETRSFFPSCLVR